MAYGTVLIVCVCETPVLAMYLSHGMGWDEMDRVEVEGVSSIVVGKMDWVLRLGVGTAKREGLGYGVGVSPDHVMGWVFENGRVGYW